ncbi:replication initiation protein, partial [Klebsiella pneumoniae]|nr:replication initiation protein [Klebsiella pneumoniae]
MKKVNQEISNGIRRKSEVSFEFTGQTCKVTHFAPGNTGTVQPVALLRLG